MLGRLCLITVTVWGLAIAGAVFAPGPHGGEDGTVPVSHVSHHVRHTDTGTNTPQPPVSPEPPPPPAVRGFAINLHHTDRFEAYLRAVDQIAGLGFNSIEVVTPAFQTNGASDQIRIEVGPGRGPQRQQLVQLLRYARRCGLTTALMPQVLFTHPRGNEWRGKIHPERWEPWWASYQRVLDDFTQVAVEAGVDVLCVGSELLSTEKDTPRWRRLIRHIRRGYRGRLTYSTNWDHYHVPGFWRDLDLIGLNGYWDITTLSQPDGDDGGETRLLARRWRQVLERVLRFAQTVGRPVLFTEIGYPSLPHGLREPWNYVNRDHAAADAQVQAMGYAAFISAWDAVMSSASEADGGLAGRGLLSGVYFYEWDPYHRGGPDDTGYGVRGKPALGLLRRWLRGRDGLAEYLSPNPGTPGITTMP